MTKPRVSCSLAASPSLARALGLGALLVAGACSAPARVAPPAASQSRADADTPEPERVAADDGTERAPEAAEGAPAPRPWVTGSSTTRLVSRTSDEGADLDLREAVVLDFGDAERDGVTAHVYGLLTADLDGSGSREDQLSFTSLADTFDGAVDAWLYHAYVDLERVQGLELVRVGRQIDYETPEFAFFDGLALATGEHGAARARFGLYGGVPVHLYESSRTGDMLLGAFGECVPWKRSRARLDWMHLEDRTRLAEHEDDLLSASLWQRAGEHLRLEGRYTHLEDEPRDVELGATWNDARHDLVVRAGWRSLLTTQEDLVLELDPFYGALQSLYPYDQLDLTLEKGLGARATLRGGFDLRRVRDDADVGTNNRDYERAFAGATVHDCLVEGLDLELDGDTWDADGREVHGFGLSLAREFAGGLAASLGTYYSLYKYDLLSATEREDVRTYFVRVQREWSESLRGELGYELDDDETDTYHTLRVGFTWQF